MTHPALAALAVLAWFLTVPVAGHAQQRPPQAPSAQAAAPRPAAQAAAPGDVVTDGALTKELLKAIYDAAKLPAALDAAGNLVVKAGQTSAYALPAKDSLRLLVRFDFQPKATLMEKLDLANRINDEYIVVRATVRGEKLGEIHLDYYVLLGAGVSRATLVAATRRYLEIVPEAIDAMDTERLIK